METRPAYTLDEVYEEAIRFCKEKVLPITCSKEKGLPKGEPGNSNSCVIANLVGRDVGMSYDYDFDEPVWPYAIGCSSFKEEPILIDSEILSEFIEDFDSGLYSELIS